MAAAATKTIFSFVSYDNHRVPQDPKSRTLIRRHAMRDVATTRKQKRNYRGNAVQYPEAVLYGEDTHEACAGKGTVAKRRSTKRKLLKKATDSNPQPTKQQLIRIHTIVVDDYSQKFSTRFPILELIAPLTSLHLGVASISCFTLEPGRTGDVLFSLPLSNLQSRRLLDYLPSLYGKASALTYTVDCLVARLNQITRGLTTNTSSEEEDGEVLHHYAKALKEIQRAIDDEQLRMAQETLYAAELLGIFELLSPNPEMTSWKCHAAGAARLIQLRGPERFKTDFELALFMAHIGPIVTESFLNNKTCFLTEEPWKKVLRTAICHDPTIPPEQSKLIYRLWSSLIFGPNIFKMVTSLVLSPTEPSESDIEAAIEKIQKDLTYLRMWEDLLRQQQQAQSPIDRDESGDNVKFVFAAPAWSKGKNFMPWPVLRGTFMMCGMLKRRLLVSLAPSRFPHVEAEAQALAETTLELNSNPATRKEDGLLGGLFLAQTVWVAKAVLTTKDIWNETVADASRMTSEENERGPIIEQWKFRIWCKELGRKVS
ncbi:uncharacterized protein TrAFT101_006838 [Trichoderma asperellum]|uniref:uncharacterized protein n=1 Tax=Trichoderma asperellum TaxID=101201 RepID=UPI00332891FB|nr:hypothetical protein TrAFT101_006838 [Trichoderma asperellum]